MLAAGTADEGLAALARSSVDLVIQDMNFRREATSGEEGIALFHEIRSRLPQVPIVLLTAWTHLETAVELVPTTSPSPGTMRASSPAYAT